MPRPKNSRSPETESLRAEMVLRAWLNRMRYWGSDLLRVELTQQQRDEIRERLGPSERTVDTMSEVERGSGVELPPSTSTRTESE